MQVNTKHNDDHQLCSVLHVIATNTESAPCVALILETALDLTGAVGAAFHTFGAALIDQMQGSVADAPTRADVDALPDGLNTKDVRLIYPVRAGGVSYGVMWLDFSAAHEPDSTERENLDLLADALAIVAARAEAQVSAERSKRLVQLMIDSVVDPLLVFDGAGHLLSANAAAVTLFGDGAVVGATFAEALASDELMSFANGDNPLTEWSYGEKTFVPRVQSFRDTLDQPDGWILTLHDITQFKKLNHSQNEFIRLVSHDIRSPLTSVQGFASMLEMVGDLNDKQAQFVDKVLSGITTITQLVDNIQDAGRFDPETGFYEMTRSHTDLREMVNRIVNNHLLPAEKQELSVTVEVADDVPILNVDSNMLERALTNLVDNAIKYTPNGGKINVSVKCENGSVIIGVSDTGWGISPENQKQLFQRHVRLARQEHKRVKGSGLGLFIVKSVAQRHGGDAWVVSAEKRGSTFFLSIPLSGANLVIPDES